MRSKLCFFGVISVLLFLMFSGIMITLVSNMINQGDGGTITDYPLDKRASTNPSTPVTLQKSIPILDTIPNETVYYKTEIASSSYFQVVWENCISGHHLLLQLYPNSSYSSLILQTGGWLIIKPDVSRVMYVGIEPQTTETSSAVIGWEEAALLTSGSEVTGTLSDAEYLDAYEIYLDSTYLYDFVLSVPVGADFDLLIQYANLSSSGYTVAWYLIKVSASIGSGVDEILTDWSPDVTGVCIVVVVCEGGTGTYSLTFTCKNCPIPFNTAMIFLGLFIGLLIYVRKGKKPL